MPRSCFVRLRDDNRSPGAMARAKDDLIKRQRVEKSASFVLTNVQCMEVIGEYDDGIDTERPLGVHGTEGRT